MATLGRQELEPRTEPEAPGNRSGVAAVLLILLVILLSPLFYDLVQWLRGLLVGS